MKIGWRYYIIE